jgi:hypothetical protein
VSQERILTALGVVALVAIVGAVAAFAVGGGDDPSVRVASASTTSSSAVAVSVPTSTSLAPSTSTTAVGVSGEICGTVEEAPNAFVAGWISGDRAAAGRCASTAAVDTLFQTSGTGAQYAFQGCDYTDPGVPICSYTYPGGSARLTIEGTEAAGWKVTKVEFVAD